MQGIKTTSAAQLAAINNARSAKSVLNIFPDFTNFDIRCTIPRGNSSGTIAGACITLLNTGALGPNAHVKSIKFRERWPFNATHDARTGHWARNEKTGGWIVTLDRNEHVRSIRVTGPSLRNSGSSDHCRAFGSGVIPEHWARRGSSF
jgi:hypothetical protein